MLEMRVKHAKCILLSGGVLALQSLPIGPKIAAIRQERRVSRAALARAVGVTPGAVQGWESGKSPVKAIYWEPVARALGVTVQDLTDDTALPNPDPEARVMNTESIAIRAVAEVAKDMDALGAISSVVLAQELKHLAARLLVGQSSPPIDLVTQSEAARILGVSRQAVNQWVASGKVQSYPNPDRPDRAPMVSLAEVQSFRGRTEEVAPATEKRPAHSPKNDPTAAATPGNSGQESS